MAPEIYANFEKNSAKKDMVFSEKHDVFSFGVMMAELVFNCRLFSLSAEKFKEVYRNGEVLDRYFFASEKIECFGDHKVIMPLALIVQRCMDPDPRKRPKFDWIAVSLKLILDHCSG